MKEGISRIIEVLVRLEAFQRSRKGVLKLVVFAAAVECNQLEDLPFFLSYLVALVEKSYKHQLLRELRRSASSSLRLNCRPAARGRDSRGTEGCLLLAQ